MKQIITVAGFVALLVTATIAAGSYIVQPASAQCGLTTVSFGKGCVSQQAGPAFGPAVSGLAKGSGLQSIRASGCGANQFPVAQGGHDVCP